MEIIKPGTQSVEELKEQAMRQRRYKLAELICLTEDMLKLAVAGDWEGLDALEKNRKEIFEIYFSLGESGDLDKVQEEEEPLIAEALATLLHLNDQIKDKVQLARHEVLLESQEYASGKQAVKSYQEIQE